MVLYNTDPPSQCGGNGSLCDLFTPLFSCSLSSASVFPARPGAVMDAAGAERSGAGRRAEGGTEEGWPVRGWREESGLGRTDLVPIQRVINKQVNKEISKREKKDR